MTNYDQFQNNEPGKHTCCFRLCVDNRLGYGAFCCVLNRVPCIGESVEFYNTPEGDFTGEVIGVHQSADFATLFPVQTPGSDNFGMASSAKPCSVHRQEWQIKVNVTSASELQEHGVPEL